MSDKTKPADISTSELLSEKKENPDSNKTTLSVNKELPTVQKQPS